MLPGASAIWKTRLVSSYAVPMIAYRCNQCSSPMLEKFWAATGLCAICYNRNSPIYSPKGISKAWSLTTYLKAKSEHPGTAIIQRAKTDRALTEAMMTASAQAFLDELTWQEEPWRPELVVPCPSSRQRGTTRSFAMGSAVGKVLDLPAHDVLVRVDDNPPRSAQEGKREPETFGKLLDEVRIEAQAQFMGEKILVVDDLATIGTTAASAAHALRQAGASDVRLLAFAKFCTKEHLEGYCD
ncbi:MAG TPA: hypothetical protein VM681_11220 [Candidatus Thermoplasmatota archaeon]|nr:hypothetical protein [Candidatus Thermoplasmatota archaeon]